MSWVSKLWRSVKGGRTDAEAAFSIVVGTLSQEQKRVMWSNLKNVLYVVDIAKTVSDSQSVKEAELWVSKSIEILDKQL
jgi:hypothetical protein